MFAEEQQFLPLSFWMVKYKWYLKGSGQIWFTQIGLQLRKGLFFLQI